MEISKKLLNLYKILILLIIICNESQSSTTARKAFDTSTTVSPSSKNIINSSRGSTSFKNSTNLNILKIPNDPIKRDASTSRSTNKNQLLSNVVEPTTPHKTSKTTTIKPKPSSKSTTPQQNLKRAIPKTVSSATHNSITTKKSSGKKTIKSTAEDNYQCPPASHAQFQLFPHYCSRHGECIKNVGKTYRCCRQLGSKRCVKAVVKQVKEPKHQPLLGLIPRKCPKEPLAELFWQLQTCDTDTDCWPRICCPDGRKKYCRTSKPELEKSSFPAARQLSYPIDAVSGYLQCTPPPPPGYDPFPKICNNTLDCFPNVCCQEAGKKHCRPPLRSLLALVTGFAQRFNTGIIKQWTDNLVIK